VLRRNEILPEKIFHFYQHSVPNGAGRRLGVPFFYQHSVPNGTGRRSGVPLFYQHSVPNVMYFQLGLGGFVRFGRYGYHKFADNLALKLSFTVSFKK
jgi:hypothetical protein